MNLKCLKKLRLKSFDESERPWHVHLDSLSDHADLSSIYLGGKLNNLQLVSKFLENLIELTLSASGLVDDPMQTLEKPPKLKILRLYSKSFTGKRIYGLLFKGISEVTSAKVVGVGESRAMGYEGRIVSYFFYFNFY
ncbi:hypothetical protein M5689_001131 [Euphorbia peplus]|nr:hypothetical protein M5689_001131 [Euphorbia peplus]